MPTVNYEIVKNVEGQPLVIRDLCVERGGMSVTNGAEAVTAELFKSGFLPDGRRLFYYDSNGDLDELVHDDGIFIDFKPGPR